MYFNPFIPLFAYSYFPDPFYKLKQHEGILHCKKHQLASVDSRGWNAFCPLSSKAALVYSWGICHEINHWQERELLGSGRFRSYTCNTDKTISVNDENDCGKRWSGWATKIQLNLKSWFLHIQSSFIPRPLNAEEVHMCPTLSWILTKETAMVSVLQIYWKPEQCI